MEQKEIFKIPYIVHEAAIYRKERVIKKLVAALVLSDLFMAITLCLFFKKKR